MRHLSPHLFIFDWDGTLSDSVGRIVTCLRRAALDLGQFVGQPVWRQLSRPMGPGAVWR